MIFTNPRLAAEFDNWPIGSGNTGNCKFYFEPEPKRGQRLVRVTTNKTGQWCKPKKDTYGGDGAIVDGDDGRTYILQFASSGHDFIYVKRSDFMHAESVFPDKPRYEELKALIEQAK